jgi:ribosome-binding protein aMBF1 (putative translation factor)
MDDVNRRSNSGVTRATVDAFDAADFGRAIRSARVDKGWTQAELAHWLNVHRVTVGRLEAGEPVALPIAMRAIALLGMKVVVVPKGFSLRAQDVRG